MKAVWKFPFPIQDDIVLKMPFEAEVLHVGSQNIDFIDVGCIWARVETTSGKETRRFQLRGTGHDAEGCGPYVGTFTTMGGRLVWHVFEEERK